MQPLNANCYIIKKHGVYFAATPTLNLTAVGSTLEEAKAGLHDAIISYLETVLNDNFNIETDRHLLKRRAPLYMYLEYAFCYVGTLLPASRRLFSFEEKLPLTLCMAR